MNNEEKHILILSDTHGYIDDAILHHAKQSHEVWHAGDIGSLQVIEKLRSAAPLRVVRGNIDAADLKHQAPNMLVFEIMNIKVLMTHITGYPKKYAQGIRQLIQTHRPAIVVGGHSHICKVMHDSDYSLLFINPGAIGKVGFHSVRTMIKLTLRNGKPTNMQVIEYNKYS